MKASPANHGYPQVGLSSNGKSINVPVHWLVAEAFLGPRTVTVDHIDGDKANNTVTNLRYLSIEDNVRAAWQRRGLDAGRLAAGRLEPKQIIEIRGRVRAGESRKNVAVMFGITVDTCGRIVRGETWSDLPERLAGASAFRPQVRATPTCGTRGGYQRHRRTLQEEPCDACRLAYRETQHAYYIARRATIGAIMPIRPDEDES